MNRISDADRDFIIERLREGKPLPERFKRLLFDTNREYELLYDGKEGEEEILAGAKTVPFREIRRFSKGSPSRDGWTNSLIFGDNLEALGTLLGMKREGRLRNADGSPGVRLIYIDPPFGTSQDYTGRHQQKAYNDRIVGVSFVEFLRKRLVLMRDLLSDDGSIYLHLDEKKSHYMKVILDEIFGEDRFQREIIWRMGWLSGYKTVAKNWIRNHDVILFYVKDSSNFIFNKEYIPYPEGYVRRDGRPPKGMGHPIEDTWNCSEMDRLDSIQIMSFSGEKTGYPTQKNENLLRRIIKASSNPGDIVLDCFAGSGTTLAVSEKLGRRWIGVDSSRFAIYTTQKRLLSLATGKDPENPSRKHGEPCSPWSLYDAGADASCCAGHLPWEEYRELALSAFDCRRGKHTIAGIQFDGYLGEDSVMVLQPTGHDAGLDRTFLDDLHGRLRAEPGQRFFIILPDAPVKFLGDYLEIEGAQYYILRIPSSVIRKSNVAGGARGDGASTGEVRQVPRVRCTYLAEETSGRCKVKIKDFEGTVQGGKTGGSDMESLSMVTLGNIVDGEVYDVDRFYSAEDLKGTDYTIEFDESLLHRGGSRIMITYFDIAGNELKEVRSLNEFVRVTERDSEDG